MSEPLNVPRELFKIGMGLGAALAVFSVWLIGWGEGRHEGYSKGYRDAVAKQLAPAECPTPADVRVPHACPTHRHCTVHWVMVHTPSPDSPFAPFGPTIDQDEYFDEEAIPLETVEYVARVAATPEVRMRWFCLPIEHRNACSRSSPWWHPWAPEERHLWTRELPTGAITELAGFRRQAMPLVNGIVTPPSDGNVCAIMGIRTQESLNRYMAIAANKKGDETFFSGDKARHVTRAYPIYDWTSDDVWLAPQTYGWDYNRAYDLMAAAGVPTHHQRCAPPFGEQPLQRLWTYAVCWPELWAKMCYRVPGAATAGRYARSPLYAMNGNAKPDGLSWREYCLRMIDKLPPRERKTAAKILRQAIQYHRDRSQLPLPETEPDPTSGMTWQALGN